MSPPKDTDVLKYYSRNQELARSETQQLEFRVCENLLNKYMHDKKLKILELGAGAGHYTRFLADKGHELTVVEPTKILIEQNRDQITQLGLEDQVEYFEIDARDVSSKLNKLKFDLILNMGPMYHIFEESDQVQLLKDLNSLLLDQGLMMSVFLSRVGFLSYILTRQPETVLADPEGLRDVLTQGFDPQHPKDGTFRGYFSDLNTVAELHKKSGWNLAAIHVLDPCLGGRDETFNQLNDAQKSAWVEVLAALSGDPNYWNSGRTWLALATKIQSP
ncbi:MAG: class I SAM-dependent methyltransferase [Bdellovibrionales bacterium]